MASHKHQNFIYCKILNCLNRTKYFHNFHSNGLFYTYISIHFLVIIIFVHIFFTIFRVSSMNIDRKPLDVLWKKKFHSFLFNFCNGLNTVHFCPFFHYFYAMCKCIRTRHFDWFNDWYNQNTFICVFFHIKI